MNTRTRNVGTFTVPVTLVGRTGDTVDLDALVDTGATYSVFPATVLTRLGVRPTEQRWFELADGRRVTYDVGIVNMRIDDREIPMLVVIDPTESTPLLGATALEIFGFAADPINQRLVRVDALLK